MKIYSYKNTRSIMCLNIYFSEKTTYTGYWTRCGVWCVVRSSWLVSYPCLYTTRRLQKQLC